MHEYLYQKPLKCIYVLKIKFQCRDGIELHISKAFMPGYRFRKVGSSLSKLLLDVYYKITTLCHIVTKLAPRDPLNNSTGF